MFAAAKQQQPGAASEQRKAGWFGNHGDRTEARGQGVRGNRNAAGNYAIGVLAK